MFTGIPGIAGYCTVLFSAVNFDTGFELRRRGELKNTCKDSRRWGSKKNTFVYRLKYRYSYIPGPFLLVFSFCAYCCTRIFFVGVGVSADRLC